MKILVCHNLYKIPGGEDKVFHEETALLRANGHEVHTIQKLNTKSIRSIKDKITLLFTTHYNRFWYKTFKKVLKEVSPDVVHVHNFFPLYSPSIFYACKSMNIPVVMTLHNYRLLYPNGLLLKNDGTIDLRTIRRSAYLTIPDKVYRNSYLQTAVVAHLIEYHRKRNTWNTKVDALICLTEFSKKIFEESGIETNRLWVKPNFVFQPKEDYVKKEPVEKIHFVFIGRLSFEKGILNLVKSWLNFKSGVQLTIIGEGLLYEEIKNEIGSSNSVHLLGSRSNKETLNVLSTARALVFPSIWYEGFPMTILESLSLGVPIVSTSIGSQGSIVRDEFNGLHYNPDIEDSLENAIDRLNDDALHQILSNNARKDFLENYTKEKSLSILEKVYSSVIMNNKKKRD
ncbi:glycosyltransferase family 4 protein [Reichenbachiella agariperforans]|uniref:glycosyltransferase family 4 protein n=1 Tax=Reichenbachiella agariperforans TaxID=156994 RepID=UPI001C0958C2|nr:glycosyltransferase family 4 protein [Reichenbachiella agariperforans]MBU2916042.1 glycosyltransferase family 4 protein [Reichenbachiella agariperforans]